MNEADSPAADSAAVGGRALRNSCIHRAAAKPQYAGLISSPAAAYPALIACAGKAGMRVL